MAAGISRKRGRPACTTRMPSWRFSELKRNSADTPLKHVREAGAAFSATGDA
jgi:hypothetical protein